MLLVRKSPPSFQTYPLPSSPFWKTLVETQPFLPDHPHICDWCCRWACPSPSKTSPKPVVVPEDSKMWVTVLKVLAFVAVGVCIGFLGGANSRRALANRMMPGSSNYESRRSGFRTKLRVTVTLPESQRFRYGCGQSAIDQMIELPLRSVLLKVFSSPVQYMLHCVGPVERTEEVQIKENHLSWSSRVGEALTSLHRFGSYWKLYLWQCQAIVSLTAFANAGRIDLHSLPFALPQRTKTTMPWSGSNTTNQLA